MTGGATWSPAARGVRRTGGISGPHRAGTAHQCRQHCRVHRFSIPLYRDGRGIWRQGRDISGEVDVAVIEIDRGALPASTVYRAFTPAHPHAVRPGRNRRVGAAGRIPRWAFTTYAIGCRWRQAIASSFGLRFQGYFLTDARTHRGTSGAPVVMRITDPARIAGRPAMDGAGRARLAVGRRTDLDEAGLNCAWYADILLSLTESTGGRRLWRNPPRVGHGRRSLAARVQARRDSTADSWAHSRSDSLYAPPASRIALRNFCGHIFAGAARCSDCSSLAGEALAMVVAASSASASGVAQAGLDQRVHGGTSWRAQRIRVGDGMLRRSHFDSLRRWRLCAAQRCGRHAHQAGRVPAGWPDRFGRHCRLIKRKHWRAFPAFRPESRSGAGVSLWSGWRQLPGRDAPIEPPLTRRESCLHALGWVRLRVGGHGGRKMKTPAGHIPVSHSRPRSAQKFAAGQACLAKILDCEAASSMRSTSINTRATISA